MEPRLPSRHPAHPARLSRVPQRLQKSLAALTLKRALAAAGVLLRQFDGSEDVARPWRGCPGGNVRQGAGSECAIYGARLSASIINREIGVHLFSRSAPGTIYGPAGVQLRCAYGGDGGTRASVDGCRNGAFCTSPGDAWCGGAPHPPNDLASILVPRGEYNEVIVDAASIEVALPRVVDAFFYMRGSAPERAARVREQFVAEHHVSAKGFPLVRLDPRNRDAPFSDG